MAEFDAILLAAGVSQRFGAENKLLTEFQGTPMIARVAQTYLQPVDGKVTVVTGYEADRVEAALHGLPLDFCHNAAFADGQQGSVIVGLHTPTEANATLIGLGDQPLLDHEDLAWLMQVHKTSDPEKISIPMRDGKRGNPIIVPRTLRSELLADRRSPGCRNFTRTHPEKVQMLPTSRQGFFEDVDTPEDFAATILQSVRRHDETVD